MRFFDAHCDTVIKVLDEGVDFRSDVHGAHVTLPGLQQAGVRAQVFACFVLSERHPGRERERAVAMISAIRRMAEESRGAMRCVETCDGLPRRPEDPIAAIIGLEGADPLQGDPEALRAFHALGVRLLIPAWKDNAFSGTAFGSNSPLTAAGRDLVALAEELGVVVDVSHLSDRAFDDVLRICRRPIVASHSDCRALCPSPRNLTDPMIRALADRGGVLGINFYPGFLHAPFYEALERLRAELRDVSPDLRDKRLRDWASCAERPPMSWIARHATHAMDVGGEDCVGLGGDLDGVTSLPQGIDSVADYRKLPTALHDAGLSARRVEKLCYGNFHRVFAELLPPSS